MLHHAANVPSTERSYPIFVEQIYLNILILKFKVLAILFIRALFCLKLPKRQQCRFGKDFDPIWL
jgi:hypothetical protein